MLLTPLSTLFVAVVAFSSASAHAHHEHDHVHRIRLPRRPARNAQQEADLHRMFKRQSNSYPTPDIAGPTPQSSWVAAYQKVKAAGLIPSIAPSVDRGGSPVYPSSVNANDNRNVCSWSITNCNATTDIVDAPDGMIGIAFDDGPQPDATVLYKFLDANNIPSTHFMIGSRIYDNLSLFRSALQIGGHIAVHTWSHPLMTTMTDAQVLGELGWTMQIIYDNTGGWLPQFWRPPYGDVDNRVRAIAEQVFGLTTVIWNQDTGDYCLNDDGTNACSARPGAPANDAALAKELTMYLTGSKSPGLIILEHEHKARAISAFINTAWPLIQSHNWGYHNIPGLFNLQYYQNAATDNSTVTSGTIAVNPVTSAAPLAPSATVVGKATGSASSARGVVSAATTAASASTVVLSQASQSAARLAAASTQPNAVSRLPLGAKVGIAIGAFIGLALLLLLATCLCIRRRRDPAKRTAGPVIQHPYENMLENKSDLSFESKDASPLRDAPTLLYAHPAVSARKSTASIYSQEHPADQPSLGTEPASRPHAAAPVSPSPARPVTLQRFHLPTSVVRSTYAPMPANQAKPSADRTGWL